VNLVFPKQVWKPGSRCAVNSSAIWYPPSRYRQKQTVYGQELKNACSDPAGSCIIKSRIAQMLILAGKKFLNVLLV